MECSVGGWGQGVAETSRANQAHCQDGSPPHGASFPKHCHPLPFQVLPSPSQDSHPSAHEAVVEGQSDESEGSLLDEVWVEDADLRGLLGHSGSHRLPEAIRCTL